MKTIRVSRAIVPLGEFKAKAASILKDLNEETGPLVITQNGRPAAVVLSPAAYDRMRERQEFLEAVASGLSDAAAGRVVGHEKVAQWLSGWGSDEQNKDGQG